jgi:hypothetical protein
MNTFDDAEKAIRMHPERCKAGRGATDALIDQAESFLSVQFPEEYREFLRRFGTLEVGFVECYGIVGNDFINSSAPDAIWYTSKERANALPHHLAVLCDIDGDELYCVDLTGEVAAPVVVWDLLSKSISRIKSSNMPDFILDEIAAYYE